MKAICKVCELLDKDTTIKEVIYCKFCDAVMCEPCERNLLRRAEAMMISKLKPNEKNNTI
jgi:hypothetical protein